MFTAASGPAASWRGSKLMLHCTYPQYGLVVIYGSYDRLDCPFSLILCKLIHHAPPWQLLHIGICDLSREKGKLLILRKRAFFVTLQKIVDF